MQIIYPKIKKILSVIILFTVLLCGSTANAAKLGDGPVLVEIQNNSLCFSVRKYKPRGYLFKSLTIGPKGFAIRNIDVSKYQKGVVWGQSLPIEKNGSEYTLKPNQCIKYGTLFNNYKQVGSQQKLESGKFTVIISGYDPTALEMTSFMSVFSIDVADDKISLKNVE